MLRNVCLVAVFALALAAQAVGQETVWLIDAA